MSIRQTIQQAWSDQDWQLHLYSDILREQHQSIIADAIDQLRIQQGLIWGWFDTLFTRPQSDCEDCQ